MAASLRLHDEIVRSGVEAHGGYVFTTAGDAFCAAFQRATDGVAAARAMQAALSSASWPGPELRVRVGLHLGEAEERNGDYFGPVVNLAARVESAGHGGQTLVTDVVRQAAQVDARDLGAHILRDVPDQVRIFQIGLGEFAKLRVSSASSTNLPTARTTSLSSRLLPRPKSLAVVAFGCRINRSNAHTSACISIQPIALIVSTDSDAMEIP